ncbi:DNA polymerase III subunit gamma/tau [Schlesneria sp. T3-172]|uniref:DNA polymerase III subunit gamma/tau n=1 Tax=Schlesneria sphaerica TaxID=3373610 RepID=UPI0037C61A88
MQSQYTVLARRFRPQTFTEVVGQERVAQTLRNAIQEGRVAHAYLFTGARGVGKTSMARIFAKALNCPFLKDGVPCNECEQCRGISVGQDVDVSEIDGASNRGIDDIRSLRANVNVKSMRSKYKVYIIDEVHMLTKEAFNALLKTLEEPPPMVKFVFCTTEANKVPDTILSRCQRFDFGTISTDNITMRLRQLAEAEGFQVDEAALELVARRAAGSMRDSQSLFDQLLAFGSEHITSADVHRLLGTAPDDRLTGLVDALIERRQDEVLIRLEHSVKEGVQLEAFTDQLVAYFRDLMVAACGAAEVPLLSVGDDSRETINRQASAWGLQTIAAAMQILAEAKARMQRVSYGRALAELALVRISFLADLDRLDTLIAQLKGGQGVPLPPRTTRITAERPASPPDRPLLPPGPKSTNIGPAEKKNDLNPPKVESQPPAVAEVTTDEAVQTPAVLELKSGCEKELQSLIADRMNDIVGASVRRIPSIAIIGPNTLEFCVPINYDLDRKALDRPDTVNRLEAIVAELVGQKVRILFRTGEAVQTAAKPTAAVAAVSRNQVIDEPEDPYIQQITEVFGVKSWSVKELVAEATDERTEDAPE